MASLNSTAPRISWWYSLSARTWSSHLLWGRLGQHLQLCFRQQPSDGLSDWLGHRQSVTVWCDVLLLTTPRRCTAWCAEPDLRLESPGRRCRRTLDHGTIYYQHTPEIVVGSETSQYWLPACWLSLYTLYGEVQVISYAASQPVKWNTRSNCSCSITYNIN